MTGLYILLFVIVLLIFTMTLLFADATKEFMKEEKEREEWRHK